MFKPVPMLKLSALILEQDKRLVLQALGQLGTIQLTRTQPGPESLPLTPRDRLPEIVRCDQLLSRLEELRRALEIPDLGVITTTPITFSQVEELLHSIEAPARELLQHRQHLLQHLGELSALSERTSGFCGWQLPLEPPDRFSFLHFAVGYLPAENLDRLQSELGENVALLPLPIQQERQPVIAMTTRQGQPALQSALQRAGFQPETFPALEDTTLDQLSARSLQQQTETASELAAVNAQLRRSTTTAGPTLAELARVVRTERCLLEAEQSFAGTAAAVQLTGWVPASEALALVQRLRELTGGRCLIETRTPEGVDQAAIPVLLHHSRLLRPFERLVAAYGLPQYQELEPTLFVAFSFVLMFGMMFGDVGQGAVLACISLAALLTNRKAKVRDRAWLLLFASLSSISFGLLYGSYFGLEQFKKYALWHDPLEANPMSLMYGAIGMGVGLISIGLLLNVLNHFRRGDVLGGCLDKFGLMGALFYWGSLALITQFAALQARGLVPLALWLFLVLPITAWTLKGPLEYFLNLRRSRSPRSAGALLASLAESLAGAFEAVLSYLANTISFVRLAAYALSHAAILLAAFSLAEEIQRASIAGSWLSVLIIIFGNLLAILLEGTIACIQALRLEYYEFFSKFFSGNGQAFRPFRLAP